MADDINNNGKSHLVETVGISESHASTCIINYPTVAIHINAEIEHNTQTSQNVNHSKVGAMANFISVSEKTGTSSMSKQNQISTVSAYIPMLFQIKKFIQIQEELDWKGCIMQFLSEARYYGEITQELVGRNKAQCEKRVMVNSSQLLWQ